MMLSSVDLPQPDGPSRATNSSGSTARSTWLSATTSRPRRSRVGLRHALDDDAHPSAAARRKRWILPVVVLGSSATKSIQRGDL